MELSRSEYWSGQPFPFPGDLPNPGIKPRLRQTAKELIPLKCGAREESSMSIGQQGDQTIQS